MASETFPTDPSVRRWPALRSLAGFGINVGAALMSLRSNWLRSFLTVLGVVIGVAAVIILAALGNGAREEITSQIDTLGTNVAVLMPGKVAGNTNFNPMGGMGLSNLREKDLEALKGIPGLRGSAPVTFISGGVYRGDRAAAICLPIATTPSFQRIRRLEAAVGRFFTEEELDEPVCVLGLGLKKDLFGDEDPIGKTLFVNTDEYRVVGVVRERAVGSGMFGGEEMDAMMYLPITAVQQRTAISQIHRVFLEVDPTQNPDVVVEQVRQTMLRAHGGRDDFSILRAKELLAMFYKIFNLMATLLIGITSISLVVGGIGIMNIMLVSVTERTREIGIRKTVGARRGDIFAQFLTEAVTLSVFGGALGIGLAALACYLVSVWSPLKPLITVEAVLLGFCVCVAVGIISGVAPALAASRKDPIEAIRYE